MKIALASDHGGYDLKEKVKKYLIEKNIEIVDLGTDSHESVDYPVFGKKCAEYVVNKNAEKGIVFCGTGIGVSIAANKVKGARCALCTSEIMAEMASKHNNSNMLALGGRILSIEDAVKIIDKWLITEFEGGRHQRRVDMLDKM